MKQSKAIQAHDAEFAGRQFLAQAVTQSQRREPIIAH